MRRLLLLLLCPSLLYGQGTKIQQSSVANLPSATSPSVKNSLFMVMDGSSTTDCTVGGGTNNVLCQSNGTIWVPIPGNGGTPGGTSIQTQVNNGGVFGGTPCESFANITTGPENVDCDWHSKGPNPAYDISRYGSRMFSTAGAQTTTANCNGTTAVTLTGAIDFANGDGIVLHQCGPATALSTPSAPSTVTPQGILNGATTRCYKVVAEDFKLGMTAASASTCTATAASVFQTVTATITNVVASNIARGSALLTVTTSANHNFQVGSIVQLTSLTGNASSSRSNGVYYIQTVPNGTTFTVQTAFGGAVNGGASPTSVATGGTASVAAHIFVYWTGPNTGVMRYWVYRQDGGAGSFNLIGVAQGIEPFYDDYGWAAPQVSPNVPEVPLTAPASAANQALATSIVSGAATTSITVANAATNTISGVTALHDDSVAWLAATNAVIAMGAQSGTVFIPASSTVGFEPLLNFPLVIPTHGSGQVTFSFNGGVIANQPIVPNSAENWFGIASGGAGTGAFSKRGYITITGFAYPMMLLPGVSSIDIEGISISAVRQQQNGLMYDQGSLSEPATFVLRHDSFGGVNTGAVGLTFRGPAFSIDVDDVVVSQFGTAPYFETPAVHISTSTFNAPVGWPGIGRIVNSTIAGSGIKFDGDPTAGTVSAAGSPWTFDNIFSENVCSQFMQFSNINTTTWTNLTVNNFNVADTACGQAAIVDLCSPTVTSLTGLTVSSPMSVCATSGVANPSVVGVSVAGGVPVNLITVSPVSSGLIDAGSLETVNDSVATSRKATTSGTGGYLHVNQPSGAIVVDNAILPVPTVALGAGGSLPVGQNLIYVITVVDANGGESFSSPASNQVTPSGGTQTATITWTPVTYPIQGYHVYRSNGGGYGRITADSGGPSFLTGTATDSAAGTNGIVSPTGNAFGLSGMSASGGLWSNSLSVFGGQFKSTTTGTFTANRTVTLPDVNGAQVVSSYQNSVYDNFNRANGAIGSNWTVANGTYNVSSNTIVAGTGGVQNVAAWTATPAFYPDQFSQATVTATGGQGVSVRTSSTAVTLYIYWTDGGNREIGRYVNGSFTSRATIAGAFSVGDLIRLEISGTTLTAYRNGVIDLTVTDSNITSGQPGISAFGVAGSLDNWSGGNLHPIAQLDTEQDWTQPQHFTQPVTIGATNPVAGALTTGLSASQINLYSGANVANMTWLAQNATGNPLLSTSSTPSIKFLDCQNTATCAQAAVSSPIFLIKGGPVAMTAGTVAVGSLPYASSTSYVCTANDVTGLASPVQVVYTSGSTVTFNGNATDSIRYICWGI